MRIIVMFLLAAAISEIVSYVAYIHKQYPIKSAISHFYSVIEAILLSSYFIYAIKPYRNRNLIIGCIIVWLAAGALNGAFLQPLGGINSNMLMLESFSFITMSLYSIYWMLKNDIYDNLFRNPHFRFAVVCLITWSFTLFFWATIKILYSNHWKYSQLMMVSQVIVGMLSYLAIAAILFFHPKNNTIENL